MSELRPLNGEIATRKRWQSVKHHALTKPYECTCAVRESGNVRQSDQKKFEFCGVERP
jgi:hypothetical protein